MAPTSRRSRSSAASGKAPKAPASKSPSRAAARPAPSKRPRPPSPVEAAAPQALPETPPVPLLPAGEPVEEGRGRVLPIDLDPRRVEEALAKLGGELKYWANKGRYTRVRFKFRGKALLPDLPLAAVVAAEGLTFYWGGILRALLMNVAGGSLLSVELVNDADKEVQVGREALLSGELEAALAHFRNALEMDRDSALAHLNLGVALKLKGDRAGARQALEQARALDAKGAVAAEAERVLATLPAA